MNTASLEDYLKIRILWPFQMKAYWMESFVHCEVDYIITESTRRKLSYIFLKISGLSTMRYRQRRPRFFSNTISQVFKTKNIYLKSAGQQIILDMFHIYRQLVQNNCGPPKLDRFCYIFFWWHQHLSFLISSFSNVSLGISF